MSLRAPTCRGAAISSEKREAKAIGSIRSRKSPLSGPLGLLRAMLALIRLWRRSGTNLPLSPQEQRILLLMAKGYRNKEIAMQLSISHNTVKQHVYNIFWKVGATNRTAAVLKAVRKHMIPPLLE